MANKIPPSVCLFCGSRFGNAPEYRDLARQLGNALAAEGWRLVYGAGNVGLMGEAANAAKEAGGVVFGVMPERLAALEVARFDLDCFVMTGNMHERKTVMFMNSDAIVVLPGGIGSLDEFCEVLTWKQLGLHNKPIILIDAKGYWNGLIRLIDGIISEGFADESLRDYFSVTGSIESLVEELRAVLPFDQMSNE